MSYLAALLCVLFILYLFFTDLRRPDRPSIALWVPLTWMFLAGSRFVSDWLNLAPSFDSARDYAEGSPIDRAVFLALIVAGLFILARRRLEWDQVLAKNAWIALYLLYCLSSALWTDNPTILAKRWVKELGNVVMVLIILTEQRPYEAIGVVLRRLAFLMLPLSVLFIKYFPHLGRWYRWDGAQTFTGVGQQKNDLGLICLMAGIYMSWELLLKRPKVQPVYLWQHKIVAFVLISMMGWLLYMSNSQTSLVCLMAAIALFLLGRPTFMTQTRLRIVSVLFFAALVVWSFDALFGLKALVLSLLGRRPDLTNRTDIWLAVRTFDVNPMIGVGFMSFWTGARLEEMWRLIGAQFNQAHNGYLEQYLNLGYVGVAFIIVIMLSGMAKASRHLTQDPAAGMLRLCFIIIAAVYNYTEASFYGMNNMWMLLLLGCIEVPRRKQATAIRQRRSMQQFALGRVGTRYRQWPSHAGNRPHQAQAQNIGKFDGSA